MTDFPVPGPPLDQEHAPLGAALSIAHLAEDVVERDLLLVQQGVGGLAADHLRRVFEQPLVRAVLPLEHLVEDRTAVARRHLRGQVVDEPSTWSPANTGQRSSSS